ncbi:hypothetical protein NP233_g3361 [Leucocoprinus birnbaumii]|uniref:NACHT domain-containing protein n=1 Tax=Leucocoprinus birnbaumii TaxID=56174 RepID=A0AAD5YYD7_9AGAR|nr:hypothetical protein NP233_g3361 [Leucocoprinus birnbaumii]
MPDSSLNSASSSSSPPDAWDMTRELRLRDSQSRSPLPPPTTAELQSFSAQPNLEDTPTGRKRKLNSINAEDNVSRQRLRHTTQPVPSVPVMNTMVSPHHSPPQVGHYSTSGSFHNAHNFQFQNPFFMDNLVQNIYPQPQINPSEVFQQLHTHGYIMQGAEYNSAERDPPPRCHPETRINILRRTTDWIENTDRDKRLLWIRGSAGVGKSAIVQTLAETLVVSESVQRLGATLFFSRPNGRSNPQQVFPTLACHLAQVDSTYKAYLTELMQSHRPLDKAMGEQFRLLIIEPFVSRRLREGQPDLLLAIDGLDECEGDPVSDAPATTQQLRERTSDRVQCEIVRLISGFVSKYPNVPLIWVIASRPETHLTAVFSSADIINTFREEDIPPDSDEACQDVQRFLHSEFSKIRENYPYHITETTWPSERKFLLIANAALGLFVFAEVVVRFIDDRRVNNPIANLEHVLAALGKLRQSTSRQNPLATLDAIYSAILEKVPEDTLPMTKELLSVIVLTHKCKVTEFPFSKIRGHLNLGQPTCLTALHHLHSVIKIPRSKNLDGTRPQFYHNSFREYLDDKSRSNDYYAGREVFLERALEHSLPRIFCKVPLGIDTIPEDTYRWIKEDSYGMLRHILTTISPTGVSGVKFLDESHDDMLSDDQCETIFDNLNFSEMARTNDLSCLDSLKLWDKEGFPIEELKRRDVLSITNIASLGIRSSTISEQSSVTQLLSTCVLYVGTPAVDSDSWIGDRKIRVRKAFASLITEAPETEVFLWGKKGGEKCAVIREPSVAPFRLKAMYCSGVCKAVEVCTFLLFLASSMKRLGSGAASNIQGSQPEKLHDLQGQPDKGRSSTISSSSPSQRTRKKRQQKNSETGQTRKRPKTSAQLGSADRGVCMREISQGTPSKGNSLGRRDLMIPETIKKQAVIPGMEECIMQGALLNSRERDPHPRCHPGTRTDILERIIAWIEDSERKQPLLWLHGSPDVGKSAIMQTLVETLLTESQRLGAALFLSELAGHVKAHQIFPTIAHQLANIDPAYNIYLVRFIKSLKSPLHAASLADQFHGLFVEPLKRGKLRFGRVFIFIDGLDYYIMGRSGGTGYQRLIALLIRDLALEFPSGPFGWIIASRPERDLEEIFSLYSWLCCERQIDLDSKTLYHDIEILLRAELAGIRTDSPHLVKEMRWPSDDNLQQLAKATSGRISLAKILLQFIGDPHVANPTSQLENILGAISKAHLHHQATTDVIYTTVLARIPPNLVHTAKEVLGIATYIHRKWDPFPLPFREICECYLNLSWDSVVAALQLLRPFILFSQIADIENRHPRLLDSEIAEFCQDSSRALEYYIDVGDMIRAVHLRYALRSFMINGVQSVPQRDIPQTHNTLQDDIGHSALLRNMLELVSPDGGAEPFDELKRRGILAIVPLSSFPFIPSDYELRSRQFSEESSTFLIDLKAPAAADSSRIPNEIKKLYSSVYDSPDTEVMVWGRERRCAMIKHTIQPESKYYWRSDPSAGPIMAVLCVVGF